MGSFSSFSFFYSVHGYISNVLVLQYIVWLHTSGVHPRLQFLLFFGALPLCLFRVTSLWPLTNTLNKHQLNTYLVICEYKSKMGGAWVSLASEFFCPMVMHSAGLLQQCSNTSKALWKKTMWNKILSCCKKIFFISSSCPFSCHSSSSSSIIIIITRAIPSTLDHRL